MAHRDSKQDAQAVSERRAAHREPSEGVTVERVTCHASIEDFEGERCLGCGINYYDWLNEVEAERAEGTGDDRDE